MTVQIKMKSVSILFYFAALFIAYIQCSLFSRKQSDSQHIKEGTRSGIITSYTAGYLNKTKDQFLKQVFDRLVSTTQATIGDVVLRDTELQFVSSQQDLISFKIRNQEIGSIIYNPALCEIKASENKLSLFLIQLQNVSLNVSFIFDITSNPTNVLEQSGIGHALINDLEIWLEVEAANTYKQTFNRPIMRVRSVKMRAKSANLMIKAGDLSKYITHLIGVIRDEYINYLSHELKGTLFNTSNKVLEDYFIEYPNELTFLQRNDTQINMISILQGSVNATSNLFSYGLDGSFFYLNHKKKNSGLKLKYDYEGMLYEETLLNNKNDSQCDLIHYISEYSMETLLVSMIEAKVFTIENYPIKKNSLKFIEGMERVYGPHIDKYYAKVDIRKAQIQQSQEGVSVYLLVEWQIKNPYSDKQLAVRLVTIVSVPVEPFFNHKTQSIAAKLSKIRIDMLEFKPYFKSQVPLKAIQQLFKNTAKPTLDFIYDFGRLINKTISLGLPLPRLILDQGLTIQNVTMATEASHFKLCLNFEEANSHLIQAQRTLSMPEYETISFEFAYLLDKDHVKLLDLDSTSDNQRDQSKNDL